MVWCLIANRSGPLSMTSPLFVFSVTIVNVYLFFVNLCILSWKWKQLGVQWSKNQSGRTDGYETIFGRNTLCGNGTALRGYYKHQCGFFIPWIIKNGNIRVSPDGGGGQPRSFERSFLPGVVPFGHCDHLGRSGSYLWWFDQRNYLSMFGTAFGGRWTLHERNWKLFCPAGAGNDRKQPQAGYGSPRGHSVAQSPRHGTRHICRDGGKAAGHAARTPQGVWAFISASGKTPVGKIIRQSLYIRYHLCLRLGGSVFWIQIAGFDDGIEKSDLGTICQRGRSASACDVFGGYGRRSPSYESGYDCQSERTHRRLYLRNQCREFGNSIGGQVDGKRVHLIGGGILYRRVVIQADDRHSGHFIGISGGRLHLHQRNEGQGSGRQAGNFRTIRCGQRRSGRRNGIRHSIG